MGNKERKIYNKKSNFPDHLWSGANFKGYDLGNKEHFAKTKSN